MRCLILPLRLSKIAAACLCALILCASCQTESEQKWYKGNLHTHSYWSDGDEFPEMIMDWYKSNDYQFVALSDHNILAEGEHWIRVPDMPVYRQGFDDYLKKYGKDWVIYKEDSGRIEARLKTYEEYKTLFEVPGEFLIIRSEEITDQFESKPIHLNATNVQQLITPKGGASVAEVLQNDINAVIEQREQTGEPVMVHINHPNFYFTISASDMISLHGERFFEVYNGHPMVHNRGDSVHESTEDMWDEINIAYAARQQPLMYGLATDDSHNYHNRGQSYSNAGRGWVMVRTDSLTPGSLVTALEEGQFYASTGVTLRQVVFRNNTLTVEIQPDGDLHYEIQFIGCKKGENKTRVLEKSRLSKASYTLDKDIAFVRARITSDRVMKNPVETDEEEMAWTQPVAYQQKD